MAVGSGICFRLRQALRNPNLTPEGRKEINFAMDLLSCDDTPSDEESQIGQIRSLTKGMEDRITFENILPELKRSLPALLEGARAFDVRFTERDLEGVLRDSIAQQRRLTMFAGRMDPDLDQKIFELAQSILLREADRRKLSGTELSPFTPLTRVPPSRRGDDLYKPRQQLERRGPSFVRPTGGATVKGPRPSPVVFPPLRLNDTRARRNPDGLWVQFRVNIAPVRTASRPGGAPAPRPSVEVTGASRGRNGSGALEAFVVTVALTAPPESAGRIELDLGESLRPVVLANGTDMVASITRKMRESPSPSAPGDPPGPDSGELSRSIEMTMDGDGLGALVGTDVDYAIHLEFGTLNMAPRPFLFSTFEEAKAKFVRDIRSAVGAIVA